MPAAPSIGRFASADETGYAQSYEKSAPFIKNLESSEPGFYPWDDPSIGWVRRQEMAAERAALVATRCEFEEDAGANGCCLARPASGQYPDIFGCPTTCTGAGSGSQGRGDNKTCWCFGCTTDPVLTLAVGKAAGGQCNYKSPRDGYSSCDAMPEGTNQRVCRCGGNARSKIEVSGFPDEYSYRAAGAPNPNGIYSLYKLTNQNGEACGSQNSVDGSYDYCTLDDGTPVHDLMWIKDASDQRLEHSGGGSAWWNKRWRLYNRIYLSDSGEVESTKWTLDSNNDGSGYWGFSNPWHHPEAGDLHANQPVTSTSFDRSDWETVHSWYIWGPRGDDGANGWTISNNIRIVPSPDDVDGNPGGVDTFNGRNFAVEEVHAN
jgi:hypothetical protein